jgi:tetratricopeptide (TPR) repeat protein
MSQVPREEKVQTTQPKEDGLYYVDDNNRVVKVPRVQEDDYFKRGSRLYRKGEYEEAASELNLYLDRCEMCKKRDATRLLLAEIAIQSGDEEDALAQLDRVVESGSDKSVITALNRRAQLLYNAGRFHEAVRDYEKIYECEGGGEEVFQRLGDINYHLQQKEEALHWYEEGIERGEVNDETIFRVATLYDSPGSSRDIEKAYRYYKLITVQYRSSPHYEAALQRVRFFEKNFFDYY